MLAGICDLAVTVGSNLKTSEAEQVEVEDDSCFPNDVFDEGNDEENIDGINENPDGINDNSTDAFNVDWCHKEVQHQNHQQEVHPPNYRSVVDALAGSGRTAVGKQGTASLIVSIYCFSPML